MGSTNWNLLGLGLALSAASALGAGFVVAEPAKVPVEAFAPTALTAKPLPATNDVVTPSAKLVAKPAAKSAAKPSAKPVANPAAKAAAKPAAKTAAKAAAKPTAKPVTQSTVKPAVSAAATTGNAPLPRQRPLPPPAASAYAQANVGLR